MLRRLFFPLFLFSAAAYCANDLSSMTDSQLCTELGIAAAHKQTALLSRLEEEGARRDKLQLTRIKPAECNKLVTEAVNQEMQPKLEQEDAKLKESYNHLESLRQQAQTKAEKRNENPGR